MRSRSSADGAARGCVLGDHDLRDLPPFSAVVEPVASGRKERVFVYISQPLPHTPLVGDNLQDAAGCPAADEGGCRSVSARAGAAGAPPAARLAARWRGGRPRLTCMLLRALALALALALARRRIVIGETIIRTVGLLAAAEVDLGDGRVGHRAHALVHARCVVARYLLLLIL